MKKCHFASTLARTISTPRQKGRGNATGVQVYPTIRSRSHHFLFLRTSQVPYPCPLPGRDPITTTTRAASAPSSSHLQGCSHFFPQKPRVVLPPGIPRDCQWPRPCSLVTVANQTPSLWQQLVARGRKARKLDGNHVPCRKAASSWTSLPPAGLAFS